jgi:hypothetical protein
VVVFLFPECIFGKDLLNNQQNFHSGSLTHEMGVIMGGKAIWTHGTSAVRSLLVKTQSLGLSKLLKHQKHVKAS